MNKWRKSTRLEDLIISHFLNYPISNTRVVVHSILDDGDSLLANIEIIKLCNDGKLKHRLKRIIL